jgi:GT2 family glycosyltransferase
VICAPDPAVAPGNPSTIEAPLLASVIISTYNRCDTLAQTLTALAKQDLPHAQYEVVVIDDGSTDRTSELLSHVRVPYALRSYRLPVNRGISAGRNAGMIAAHGQYLILLSDDLLVSENFVSAHVRTLERFPDAWVVGGFSQLEDLRITPFGRYLDGLEQRFAIARTATQVAPNVFDMHAPTARNMSLPRSDIDRVGLFDERFLVTCEDQDLAQRASELGIRFLYNGDIHCVHNDRAADLNRYCRFQERGAIDTVRLCRKYPDIHGGAAIAVVNGSIRRSDSPVLIAKKVLKSLLAQGAATAVLEAAIRAAERAGLDDRVLFTAYRAMIGLYTFRGWRTGLREPTATLQLAAKAAEDVNPD